MHAFAEYDQELETKAAAEIATLDAKWLAMSDAERADVIAGIEARQAANAAAIEAAAQSEEMEDPDDLCSICGEAYPDCDCTETDKFGEDDE